MRTAMIRCDASPDIGTGHFIRSFALAQALSPDFKILFAYKKLSNDYIRLLRRQGWGFIKIPLSWTIGAEVKYLEMLILKKKIALFIVDTYRHSPRHLAILKKQTLLLSFNDFDDSGNPSDIIYSPYAMSETRQGLKGRLSLLGMAFLTFSKDLQKIRNEKRSEKSKGKLKIIFSLGGGNQAQLTHELLKCLVGFIRGSDLIISLGSLSRYRLEKLKRFCRLNALRAVWLRTPVQLWREMKTSDLAVVSGGLTKYEAAYLGVPSITFARNEVEDLDCRCFEKRGLSLHAGKFSRKIFHKGIVPILFLLQN